MSWTQPQPSVGVVERRIHSSRGSYVIVAYEDGTVAIKDHTGLFITGWPMTISLHASTIQSRTDGEILTLIGKILGTREPLRPQ